MRRPSILSTFFIAVLVTLAVSVGGILWAMFTSNTADGRHEALFGGVYFHPVETADGVTATLGVGNPWVLVGLFVMILAALLTVRTLSRRSS